MADSIIIDRHDSSDNYEVRLARTTEGPVVFLVDSPFEDSSVVLSQGHLGTDRLGFLSDKLYPNEALFTRIDGTRLEVANLTQYDFLVNEYQNARGNIVVGLTELPNDPISRLISVAQAVLHDVPRAVVGSFDRIAPTTIAASRSWTAALVSALDDMPTGAIRAQSAGAPFLTGTPVQFQPHVPAA